MAALAWTVIGGVAGAEAPLDLPTLAGTQEPDINEQTGFTKEFATEDCSFRSTSDNPYLTLRPGRKLVYEGVENGTRQRFEITVLEQTKVINVPELGAVRTRVVKEVATENGRVVENALNYFAMCAQTKDVYYFGEDVDNIAEDGTVDHEGSWLAGTRGAEPGIIMPGTFLLGARYFQELAPGSALDRAEHVAMEITARTAVGTFDDCVRTRETTPLEPGVVEFKTYCPGVGMVFDGPLKLISIRR